MASVAVPSLVVAHREKGLSWNYRLKEGSEMLSALDISWLHERARFSLGLSQYTLVREGWFRGAFGLVDDEGQVLVRAHKPNFMRRSFQIDWKEEQLTLKALSPVSSDFGLFRGGQRLGTIRATRPSKRKVALDLAPELPLEVRVFLFSLVVFLWKRGVNSG